MLQLGDCIDGRNRPDGSQAALRDVKVELDRLGAALPLGVVSTLGNHDLYNFPKERWAREVRPFFVLLFSLAWDVGRTSNGVAECSHGVFHYSSS